MIPLRSITSRTITAPASLVRRSTRASITTPALKLGWKVDGVSPMGCSALADIKAQMPESATHLAQEPAQSAVSTNIVGFTGTPFRGRGSNQGNTQNGKSLYPVLFTKAGENWRQFPDFPLLATEELNHLPRHMRHPLGETPSTQPIGWLF